MSKGLQPTYAQVNTANRSDFNRNAYEDVIAQKGQEVIFEKSLQCPCKSKSTNQQSNCKNCGGTGYVFINPVRTRMVLQGMNITPNYKAWSEEITGDLKVSASDSEGITTGDRITVENGIAKFNEVLFFKTRTVSNTVTTFAFAAYNIKSIEYAGYFAGVSEELVKLTEGTDYIFYDNIVKLINPALVPIQGEISVTVRYTHAPQYLMIDMKRESMQTYNVEGNGEKLVNLPVSGTARRQHYVLHAPNLNGDNIIDNSYEGRVYVNKSELFTFNNITSIILNHNISKFVTVTVYDENDSIMTVGVGYTTTRIDAHSVKLDFPQSQSGNAIVSGVIKIISDGTQDINCGKNTISALGVTQKMPTTFPFVNQITLLIRHDFNRYVNLTVYDNSGLIMTPNVAYEAKKIDNNNVLITFNDPQSGVVVIS